MWSHGRLEQREEVILVEGDISTVGVPDLFRSVASERASGCLTILSNGVETRIFFRRGEVYFARILGSGMRLGARLISAGILDEEQLEQALATQRSDGGRPRLGEVVVRDGLASPDQIKGIVREQIEDNIFEVLRWENGPYRFDSGVVSAEDDIGLSMSVENLIMEGARRFREWHLISKKIPTLDAVPRLTDDDTTIDVSLKPEEWAFLSHVDGVLTVGQLGHICGFTDLEAARTAFGLVTTGVLLVDLPEGVELTPDDPELEAAFAELDMALDQAAAQSAGETIEAEEEPELLAEAEAELLVVPEPELLAEAEPELLAEPEPELLSANGSSLETVSQASAGEAGDNHPVGVPSFQPDPDLALGADISTLPAAVTESTTAVADPPRLIAEEQVEWQDLSASQLFAEMSTFKGTERSEVEPEPEPEEEEPATPAHQFKERTPVDPSVDTTALLRELSGLGPERQASRKNPGAAVQEGKGSE